MVAESGPPAVLGMAAPGRWDHGPQPGSAAIGEQGLHPSLSRAPGSSGGPGPPQQRAGLRLPVLQRRLAPSFAWSRCQTPTQTEAFVCNNCAALNYGFNKIKRNGFYLRGPWRKLPGAVAVWGSGAGAPPQATRDPGAAACRPSPVTATAARRTARCLYALGGVIINYQLSSALITAPRALPPLAAPWHSRGARLGTPPLLPRRYRPSSLQQRAHPRRSL